MVSYVVPSVQNCFLFDLYEKCESGDQHVEFFANPNIRVINRERADTDEPTTDRLHFPGATVGASPLMQLSRQ